jgi:hypothetical protein
VVEVADVAAVGRRESSTGVIWGLVWWEAEEDGMERMAEARVVRVVHVQSLETMTKRAKRRVVTRVIVGDIMVTRQGGQEGKKWFSGDSVRGMRDGVVLGVLA